MREEGGEEIATGSVTTRATDPSSSIKSQTKISSCVAHRAHTVAKPKADDMWTCAAAVDDVTRMMRCSIASHCVRCIAFCLFCFNFLSIFFCFFLFLPTFFSAFPLGFFFRYLKNSSVLNCCHVFIVVEFGLVCAWRARL